MGSAAGGRGAAAPSDFGGNMDLFDYCNYESDSFSDSAPPHDFRVQRTPCVLQFKTLLLFVKKIQNNLYLYVNANN